MYGDDRLFVYLRQTGELDGGVAALKNAGFPVIEFPFMSPYDVGAEFFRWEIAISVACHVLGINTFDQPDVQDAKEMTKAKIAEYQKNGALPESDLVSLADAKSALKALLGQVKAGDYIAVNAYLPRNADTTAALTQLRLALRAETGCATTAGFGPRFQHSTGQLHKGGPDSGVFIQIVADTKPDLDIPTQGMSFRTLERAQALGDYEALRARGRRALRIHLPDVDAVNNLVDLL
jgi:transaldolase/glucose-6-phosphate isomerase